MWALLTIAFICGLILLNIITRRGAEAAPTVCSDSKPQVPPALRSPGVVRVGERRKSVTFEPHCTPPSERRGRQLAHEAILQRNRDLWQHSNLAERRLELEERSRQEAATKLESVLEETRRAVDEILRCKKSRDAIDAAIREDSGRSSSCTAIQPYTHNCHQAQTETKGSEDDNPVAPDSDGEEEDVLMYLQKKLKHEQDEVTRIEEELRKIEEENMQIESEIAMAEESESDADESDPNDENDQRNESGDEDLSYARREGDEHDKNGSDDDDDESWDNEELEEEVRTMEDEIRMIEEEQRFIEEENRKIEQELLEEEALAASRSGAPAWTQRRSPP